jgi:hypothetical protein
MILRTVYIFSLYYLWIIPFSHANDSAVAFKNSEINYQTNQNIEMQKEHLTITEEKVKVDYVFFNHGPEVTLDVAFPLPASPTFEAADGSYPNAPFWDPIFETYDHLDCISGLKDPGTLWGSPFFIPNSHRPFANFIRTEEGKRKPYEWKIIARDRTGKDITESLKRHKIPLSANYLNGVMDTPGLELHPEFVDPLRRLGLLVKKKADFQTQVIFHWKSIFPAYRPKRTSHTYCPQCGFFMFHIAKGRTLIPEDRTYANHNAPRKFLELFWNEGPQRKLVQYWMNEAKKEKNPQTYSYLIVYRLRYILTTGKNWKHGRIRDFTLTVPIPKNTEVFILGIDGLKKVGNTWKAELKNFTPQHELNIFYVRKES